MYLKELRINGFKSFADPTRLTLERGVTAIVGPNGCGKSNIADAIRWVLGEQSAKSLRAGAMQDVIFQGTTGRKPLNFCEVSLVFGDCEAQLGTAYSEVEVTRRVLREGGSDYFLNGKSCRLKDIQRLFLDTGVGQVSYSFMLQGQIDQVLSSNPSERRAIFEEAAGISRYKAQRREALNKLSQVEANLARVTDVMEEVSRQIGSLKRQAAKALRYKRVRHRLTHLDLAESANRHARLAAEIAELTERGNNLRTQVERIHGELEAAESGLSGRRERRAELSASLQALQQKVFDLRSEKDNARSQAEFAAQRGEDLGRRIEAIEAELRELEQQKKALTERVAGEHEVKREQLDLFGGSDDLFKEKSDELAQIQTRLGDAETALSRARQALMLKENAITRLRSNCTTLEVDLKTYQVRHSSLTEEIHILEEESAVLVRDYEQLQRALETRREERLQQDTKTEESRAQVSALMAEFRSLQVEIQDHDRRLAGVRAQLNVLTGLQEKFEGFSDGAKAILQGKLDGVIAREDCAVLMKSLRVDSAYTRSIEALLGAATDGIVVRDSARLGPVAAALAEKKLGRASLLVPTALGARRATAKDLPTGMMAASEAVTCKDADLAPVVGNLLAGCYLAATLDDFLKFWNARPDFDFVLVVTGDGELVDARGVIYAGAQSGKRDTSYLARENEIRKFTGEAATLEEQLETRRLNAEQLQRKIEAAEKRVEEQRRRVMELAQEVSTLEAQLKAAERNREQAARTRQSKFAELERLEESRDASNERLVKARAELEQSERDIDAQKTIIAECENAVTAVREERELKREEFNEIRIEIAEKRQRIEALERGLTELQNQTREVNARAERRGQELAGLREQVKQLAVEAREHGERAGEFDKTLADTMRLLERDRDALAVVEKEIRVVEEGFSARREAYDRMSKELNSVDIQLARQQSQIQFIAEEIHREYELNIATVDWKKELWEAGEELPERIRVDIEDESPEEAIPEVERGEPTEEDFAAMEGTDWEAVRREVENLRTRIHAMGPVNLVAIEEYKELKERHEFLKTQSDDLWQSKDQLVAAIDEINKTSQELFANTFTQIRKNFKYTFETLFGGGNSDLQLVDNGDVLESGIDISAQPPGTRLRSLALLSGGQKTMTAVALLFAIYMVKPSPFCVLDEIDAPLDDANIGRFTKMLEHFLEYSQFLIITHNKRTIRVADTIYGATMQERGVSRVISMRFNRDTGEAEALQESATGEQSASS